MVHRSISDLSFEKRKMIELSNQFPKMYITIESYEFDTKKQTILFNVEIGRKLSNFVYIHSVKVRYSQLFELNFILKSTFGPSFNKFTKYFPPNFFLNYSQSLIQKRKEKLEIYLEQIALLPFFSVQSIVIELFLLD